MDVATMKYYYAAGLWPRDRLDKVLAAGKITKDQYDEIIGGEDLRGDR